MITYCCCLSFQAGRNGQPLGTPLTPLKNVQNGSSGIHNGMVSDPFDLDESQPTSFN